MNTLAIDPGTRKSAYVEIDDLLKPIRWGWDENDEVQSVIARFLAQSKGGELVIEDVQMHSGMPMGKDTIETIRWSGRFDYYVDAHFIQRSTVKAHICGTVKAKDSNVRQAVIDRYGGQETAIGGKRCAECGGKGWFGVGRPQCLVCVGTGKETPEGILYDFSKAGMGSHGWSALALALAHACGTEGDR